MRRWLGNCKRKITKWQCRGGMSSWWVDCGQKCLNWHTYTPAECRVMEDFSKIRCAILYSLAYQLSVCYYHAKIIITVFMKNGGRQTIHNIWHICSRKFPRHFTVTCSACVGNFRHFFLTCSVCVGNFLHNTTFSTLSVRSFLQTIYILPSFTPTV